MKLPSTRAIVAYLAGITAPVLAFVTTQAHWSTGQTVGVAGAAGSTIALVAFVVEHRRKETPSRWVGVFGLIPAEISAVAGLGFAFGWWNVTSGQATSWVMTVGVPLAALFGVNIAQAKVTSPETMRSEVRVARASARRGGGGTGVPPA